MKKSQEIAKANKTQKNLVASEHKSLKSYAISLLSVAPCAELVQFYEGARVPSVESSNAEKYAYICQNVAPFLPFYIAKDGARVFVTLTENKKNALQLTESEGAEIFRNLGAVSRELFGRVSDDDARKNAIFYIEREEKRAKVLKTNEQNGGAGIVYETKDGARVYERVKVRKYICARVGGFTFGEVWGAFASAVGITAAIDAAKLEEMQQRAAAAVVAADEAKKRAEMSAQNAQENAKKAKARASEKAKNAEKVSEREGLTLEQAREIHASAKASEGAEIAEKAQATDKTQQSKKTNTKTPASDAVQK